jgi:hypothetical protein
MSNSDRHTLSAADHSRGRRLRNVRGGQHRAARVHDVVELHLTVVNKAGLELKSLADSTGEIAGV